MVKKKTHQKFVQEVHELGKGEYEVVGQYVKTAQPIELFHKKCKEIVVIRPADFLRGSRCKECTSLNDTPEKFSKKVKEKSKGLYEYLDGYTDHKCTVTLWCTKHQIEFTANATSTSRGRLVCKKCVKDVQNLKQRKPLEKVQEQLFEKHRGNIEIVGDYYNTHTKAKFLCHECNVPFHAEPNSVIRISGCPNCATSHGEKLVRNTLTELNVPFEEQKYYDECRGIRPLPFDFFIPSLNTLIEYDGKQHFEPVDFFGGEEGFLKRQEYDNIKTTFAHNSGINLLRISYKLSDEQVVSILTSLLK